MYTVYRPLCLFAQLFIVCLLSCMSVYVFFALPLHAATKAIENWSLQQFSNNKPEENIIVIASLLNVLVYIILNF